MRFTITIRVGNEPNINIMIVGEDEGHEESNVCVVRRRKTSRSLKTVSVQE